ncbi:MAG: hypothetical protein DMG04_08790 [Acidobacteria bacterium]|nr:MAG: hypothetical protein DMG04_08790 [Acidobacteriota bacterium]
MEPVRARLVATLFVLLAVVAPAYAQVEATIVGTVADESKAVLPGVTVTAADLATGRQFTDVTDVRGEYRLVGMQAGKYKVQAELAGFAPSVLSEVELLVGPSSPRWSKGLPPTRSPIHRRRTAAAERRPFE